MGTSKDEQVAWIRAVMAYLGVTATQLARRAKLAPSTLHRPLYDADYPGMISGRSLAKVAEVAGLKPLEFPVRATTFSEPETSPYAPPDVLNPTDYFHRAIRDLCAGRNGRDPWIMRGYALDLSGILPGDVLIVDMNIQPKAGDIVCAQIYDWSRQKAETVMRRYDPPYLVARSMREPNHKPLLVDDENVIIRGVIGPVLRETAAG